MWQLTIANLEKWTRNRRFFYHPGSVLPIEDGIAGVGCLSVWFHDEASRASNRTPVFVEEECSARLRPAVRMNNLQRHACVNSAITRDRCARMAPRAPAASLAMIAVKIRW